MPGSLSYGSAKWWKIGQLSFFDGRIFGGPRPGYYDRDYKWWRSSSKLHFSLYLDHSGCPGQGRSWFQNRNNDGMISTSGRKWFQIWNWEQHLAWLGSWVVWTECLIWFLFIDKWFKVRTPTKSLKLHKANMKMEMKVWRLRKGGVGWIPLVIDIICSPVRFADFAHGLMCLVIGTQWRGTVGDKRLKPQTLQKKRFCQEGFDQIPFVIDLPKSGISIIYADDGSEGEIWMCISYERRKRGRERIMMIWCWVEPV